MSNINNTSNINGTNKINGTDNAGNTIRTGLVLEGGGMRGMYTDGILDVFMDQGLFFDGVIGVSAGTIHGSSFVSGQKGRNIRYYKKYIRDNRFISMRNLIKTGDIAEVKFCYHDLPEQLDLYDYDAFNRSKTEFYAVCSNVETGEPEYIRITDMKKQIDVIRGVSVASLCITAGGDGRYEALRWRLHGQHSAHEVPGDGICEERGNSDPAEGIPEGAGAAGYGEDPLPEVSGLCGGAVSPA